MPIIDNHYYGVVGYDAREVEKLSRQWSDELERADLARELADAFDKRNRTAIKMSVDRMYREGWL